jgi:hypothetical protein
VQTGRAFHDLTGQDRIEPDVVELHHERLADQR